ncbi:unnamed protein product [Soboliphyme baturini]|uniref:Uncharacterized protein n=1 Tax=Soboliphyme baturini TaxID=241478 RepID=A0A183J8S7_9BILA|nr:unnamed protein product [Soboliphyme baturini]
MALTSVRQKRRTRCHFCRGAPRAKHAKASGYDASGVESSRAAVSERSERKRRVLIALANWTTRRQRAAQLLPSFLYTLQMPSKNAAVKVDVDVTKSYAGHDGFSAVRFREHPNIRRRRICLSSRLCCDRPFIKVS